MDNHDFSSSDRFYDPEPFSPNDKPLEITGPIRPRLPDGDYQAIFIGHRTTNFYGPRVELIFGLIVPGESPRRFGMFLSVGAVPPPIGNNGRFLLKGPRSKFAKLLCSVTELLEVGEPPTLQRFAELKWTVTLESPERDSDGNPIPSEMRYSVIARAIPRLG
jgi:hypothetical protein